MSSEKPSFASSNRSLISFIQRDLATYDQQKQTKITHGDHPRPSSLDSRVNSGKQMILEREIYISDPVGGAMPIFHRFWIADKPVQNPRHYFPQARLSGLIREALLPVSPLSRSFCDRSTQADLSLPIRLTSSKPVSGQLSDGPTICPQ
jgi:hypothetical protein